MSRKKLGERLVQRGAISWPQLQTALQAQLLHGGHLGTCLIELGYLDERRLGEVLAEIHGVPYADARRLANVSPPIIQLVPRRLVQRFRVVPFALAGGPLDVALVEPNDLAALDEIAFVTGFRIRPWVSPEIRVLQAMEVYYAIPRRPRFVALAGGPGRGDERTQADEGVKPARGGGLALARTAAGAHTIPVAPAQPGGLDRQPPRIGDSAAAFQPEPETPDPTHPRQDEDPLRPPTEGLGPGASRTADLEEAAQRLAGLEDPGRIAAAVLDYVAADAARCVLFAVDGTAARLWDWRGLTLSREAARGLEFSVTGEATFELLAGEEAYRGPIPDGPRYRWFFRELEMELPAEALLVPARLDDRLVAILYADGGARGRLARATEDYRELMRRLERGLTLAGLGRKLRRT